MASFSFLRSAVARSLATRLPLRQAVLSHSIVPTRESVFRLNVIRSFSETSNVAPAATQKSAEANDSAAASGKAPTPKKRFSYAEFMDLAARQVYVTVPKGHDIGASKNIFRKFGDLKALKLMQPKPTKEEGGNEGAESKAASTESKETAGNEDSSPGTTLLVEFVDAAAASKMLSTEMIDVGNGVTVKPSAPHALQNKKNKQPKSFNDKKHHPDAGLTVHVSTFSYRDLTESNIREALAAMNVTAVGDIMFPAQKENPSSKDNESSEKSEQDPGQKPMPRFCFVRLSSKDEVEAVVKAQSYDKKRMLFSRPIGVMSEEEKASARDARNVILKRFAEEMITERAERHKRNEKGSYQQKGGQRRRQAPLPPPNHECQVLLVSDDASPWDRTQINMRMQSYGPVKSIIVPKEQNKICFVEFERKDVATEVASAGSIEFEDGKVVTVRHNGEGRIHQRNHEQNYGERSSRSYGDRSERFERSPRRSGDRATRRDDRRDGRQSSSWERNERMDDFHTRAGVHTGPDAEEVLRNQQRQQRRQGARRDKALAAATEAHVKLMKDFASVVGAKHASEGDEETREIYAFYSSALAKLQNNGALSEHSKLRVSNLLGHNLGIGMDSEANIADDFVEKLNKKTDLFS